MIHIKKPITAPTALTTRGTTTTTENSQTYDTNPSAYDSGTETFDFNGDIYGHKTVKQALLKAQHNKCCFCESEVRAVAHGDVEHYRPKKAWSQDGSTLERPGYYWLAYDWLNLYFACQICNQSFKKNHFPLADDTQRARNHHADLSTEDPLLIDPGTMDPESYITFHGSEPIAVSHNARGERTIDATGLTRVELWELRQKHLNELKHHLKVIKTTTALEQIDQSGAPPELAAQIRPQLAELRKLAEQSRQYLIAAVTDERPYTAMARAFLCDKL